MRIFKKLFAVAACFATLLSCEEKGKLDNNGKDSQGGNYDGIESQIVRQADWNVEVTGSSPEFEEGRYFIEGKVTAPGSNLIGMFVFEDEEVEKMVETILEAKDYIASQLETKPVSELLAKAEDYSLISYPAPGKNNIVIIDFDQNGNLTGKYAHVVLNLPGLDENPGEEEGYQDDWIITYEGYKSVDFSSGAEMCEVIKVTGTGSVPCYFTLAKAGEIDKSDVASLLAMAEQSLKEDLEYYGEYGWTFEDFVYAEDPRYEYFDAFDEGEYEAFVFSMDNNGKATGKYAWASFTVSGSNPGTGEEEELYDRIAVNGTGDALFTFNVYSEGEITSANLEESILELGQELVDEYYYYKALYEAFGMTFDYELSDFMLDSHYNYYDYYAMDKATYDVLVIGLGADGNPTGEYNISKITVDGHELQAVADQLVSARARAAAKLGKAKAVKKSVHAAKHHLLRKIAPRADEDIEIPTVTISGAISQNSAWKAEYLGRFAEEGDNPGGGDDPAEEEDPVFQGTLDLQSNWTVSVVGQPYVDDGYDVIDINISVPGIKYYFLEANSDDELEYYYRGDVRYLIGYYDSLFKEYIDAGYTIGDFAYSASDPATYMDIYVSGEVTVYIMEFDKDGNATGRYGASKVVIPEFESSYDAPALKSKASRTKYRIRISK